NQWMIPGQKLNIFPGERALTIARDGDALRRQSGERVREYSSRAQLVCPGRNLLNVDRVLVENTQQEIVQERVVVLFMNLTDQILGNRRTKGVQFQQSITALMQSRCDVLMRCACFLDQPLQIEPCFRTASTEFLRKLINARSELFEQFPAALQVH